MNYCREERGKGYWIKRILLIPPAIAAGIFLFGVVVMFLWNSILPSVIGVSTITFWQALGILVLAKILFGGFPGGKSHHKMHHNHSKMMHMSPEEREKFKAEMRERCGHTEKE